MGQAYTTLMTPIDTDQAYMNTATGSVDTYDGWWYEAPEGDQRNAVDLQEVIPVWWNKNTNQWEKCA